MLETWNSKRMSEWEVWRPERWEAVKREKIEKLKNDIIIFKKKFTRNFRDYGFFVCLNKTIFYLAKPIYEMANVVLFKTDLENMDRKELYHNNLDYKWVASKDARIIKQIEEIEEWLTRKLETSIENNKLCLAALKNKKVIGFYLISLRDIYLPSLFLKVLLKNDEAFGEQITVLKRCRRWSPKTGQCDKL